MIPNIPTNRTLPTIIDPPSDVIDGEECKLSIRTGSSSPYDPIDVTEILNWFLDDNHRQQNLNIKLYKPPAQNSNKTIQQIVASKLITVYLFSVYMTMQFRN
jgi:hypothetical protein